MDKKGSTMSFETVLSKICGDTSVRMPDRRIYTRDFNVVTSYIFSVMKNQDPVFKQIASSPVLAGSCADNLKVKLPDEFDLVIQLKIQDQHLIDIEYAEDLPEYVKLNVNRLLEKIKRETHNVDLYHKLEQLSDENGYLVQAEFHSWMQGLFASVLNQFPNKTFRHKGKTYKLKESIQGPANKITVEVRNRIFSIDFVPALTFPTDRWYPPRPCPLQARHKNWIAIPKPRKQNKIEFDPDNLYWKTSYVDQERYFIHHKYSLKPSIRLLKQLRDSHNITNLKSYFIKTAFLWALEEKKENFWMKSLGTVFIDGFENLLDMIENDKEIPFFWDEQSNMLAEFNQNQISDIRDKLRALYDKIVKCQIGDPEELYGIFFPGNAKLAMKNCQ